MKSTSISALIALALSSNIALAGTYRAEVTGTYLNQDDIGDTYAASGSYYFQPVDTSNKPLAEAAFLDRASSLTGFVARADIDYYDATADTTGFNLGFYVPNTIFYLGAGYTHYSFDYPNSDSESDGQWSATLGVAPLDGLLVTTEYNEDDDGYDPNIHVKYVMALARETALNIEGSVTHNDNGGNATSLLIDYYFTRKFSLGAGYADGDDWNEDDSASLRAKYFITEAFSVGLECGVFTDNNQYLIDASVRF